MIINLKVASDGKLLYAIHTGVRNRSSIMLFGTYHVMCLPQLRTDWLTVNRIPRILGLMYLIYVN